jgi:hypothetical protein
MTTPKPTAVWDTMREALHAYAGQLRREASGRRWTGPSHASYRALLHEQSRLALAMEEMVDGINPVLLAQFLIISQSRPQAWPGGPELWPVANDQDASRRALTWAQAGNPSHRFSGGPDERMCRVCTGDLQGIQHREQP